ncbi:hypothetical protein ACIBQ1_38190 [Nonomuraea sp. NPDC050153]|uniref:hypothetical protein n=1 Tax=Nonomuraea sp. NPDC050153 TaxID=3364359 RepID=UPI0037ACC9A3
MSDPQTAADREQYERWVDEQIGPRQVGQRYDHGYEDSTYEVLAIERGPRATWPVWRIKVRDQAGERWHCTGWDPRWDRVVATTAPAPEGSS